MPNIDYEALARGPMDRYNRDLEATRRKSLASAMAQVDRITKLNPIDRQRVVDALSRRYSLNGTIHQSVIDRILQYARQGSYGVAQLALQGKPSFLSREPTSLDERMLDMDLDYGNDPRYWSNRSRVEAGIQNATAIPRDGRLTGFDKDRIVLSAMDQKDTVRKLDAVKAQMDEWSKHPAEQLPMSSMLMA